MDRDLSDVFSFTSGKNYFLQIETKAQDCYTVSKEADCKHRTAATQQALEYSSPEKASVDVDFKATTTKVSPTETFGEWLKRNTPERRNVDDTIVAFGTSQAVTEQHFNSILAAHAKAIVHLKQANDYLKHPLASSHKKLYVDWFGKYSKPNYETVRDNFIETYDGAKQPHVYNFLPTFLCKAKWLAHVDSVLLGKKQHVINICPHFFNQATSQEERIITLTHEMTHDSAATQDQKLKDVDCYGEVSCKALARSDPSLAIWSAESYALFASEVDQANLKRKATPPVSPIPHKKPKKKPLISVVQRVSEDLLLKALVHLMMTLR